MSPYPQPAPQRPLLALPEGGGTLWKLELQADFFDGQIDLPAFSARFPRYEVLSASPMVLEPEVGRFLFLSRFGAVVAWNCSEALIRTFLADLQTFAGVGRLVESARDRLTVHVGAQEDRVGYNEVWLGTLTLEKLRIISQSLAQSVALDHFDAQVSAALGRFHPVVAAMRLQGRLGLKHSDVLKLVGFAMEARSSVLNSLALFDDPPETWESETLDRLHQALKHNFDLRERLDSINQKLGYLADAGATVMDVLSTRTSHRLEWIVIILIFIETAFFVYKEVLFP